tara:strand:- start:2617 stop:2841 length:225 start_codon:yes stop_codon:yes gene_type:complete
MKIEKVLDLEHVVKGEQFDTQITLTTSEADSLAAVLNEHVIKGEMFAGHSGPLRRAYPYLTELAAALCEQKDRV